MARLCIVALAALCSLAATAYGGWTDLTPSANTRIVYVSVDGDDLTGETYFDWQVGGDPFHPIQPMGGIKPFKTIKKGMEQLRNNHPDWLLLKRGDTWTDTGAFIELNKSGLSNIEPILISAYGQGDRPFRSGQSLQQHIKRITRQSPPGEGRPQRRRQQRLQWHPSRFE